MGLIPPTNEGKILFYQSKVAPWTTNASAIGTTSTLVTAMGTKATLAQAKLAAAIAAREVSKNATADLDAAVRDLGKAGGDIIKQVRAKAATDGEGVYLLAQIPAPATPSPVPAPGTPTAFVATLNPDGSLKLKWTCANPSGSQGTIYQVSRRGPGGTLFALAGTSGTRSFLDAAVPAGVASVTYRIVAARSTATGTAAQFTVNFGTVGGTGEMIASVEMSPKLAA